MYIIYTYTHIYIYTHIHIYIYDVIKATRAKKPVAVADSVHYLIVETKL